MFATVDLPEPDSPTMASVVPRRILKLTSSTALNISPSPFGAIWGNIETVISGGAIPADTLYVVAGCYYEEVLFTGQGPAKRAYRAY